MYYCKECKMPVVVTDEKVIRSCKHTGTVVAPMTAVARGHSSVGVSTNTKK